MFVNHFHCTSVDNLGDFNFLPRKNDEANKTQPMPTLIKHATGYTEFFDVINPNGINIKKHAPAQSELANNEKYTAILKPFSYA